MSLSRRAPWRRISARPSGSQPPAQRSEAARHTAVDEFIPDLDRNATLYARIDDDVQMNLVPVHALERGDQPLALTVGARDGPPCDRDEALPPLRGPLRVVIQGHIHTTSPGM